ncbi:MAG: hypothetical protein K2M49_02320 [Muribaculaceae bacterium]|nr:hypothetical protein [Muribaculaceae bacterium]
MTAKFRRAALLALPALIAAAVPVGACTSALIGGELTRSGRALLWKHRDSGFEQNFIEQVEATDSTAAYVALFNGGDSLLREAWCGFNEHGFAVMNTASYNLAPDTARLRDREGLVMSEALRRCRSVGDFGRMLDSLPRPMGVQANFGVVDSNGAGAYFETSDTGYVRFDLRADSLLVRTNFSVAGCCGDGLGLARYEAATALMAPHVANRSFAPQLLTDTLSRSFFDARRGIDILQQTAVSEVVDRGDYIPRRSTSASIAIEVGPEPVMWVILGYPPLSTARAVRLNDIDPELRPTLPGARSPLSDRNVRRRNELFTKRKGQWVLNLQKLRNQ